MKTAKTLIVAVALLVSIVGVAVAAGPFYGPGRGYYAVAPEDAQKVAQFQSDIQPLRDRMFQLRTEIHALRGQTPTDWNAIAAKQKEMVDIRTEIQRKGAEAGVACCGYGPRGYGRGMGRSAAW
jgi:hypothetical protein